MNDAADGKRKPRSIMATDSEWTRIKERAERERIPGLPLCRATVPGHGRKTSSGGPASVERAVADGAGHPRVVASRGTTLSPGPARRTPGMPW